MIRPPLVYILRLSPIFITASGNSGGVYSYNTVFSFALHITDAFLAQKSLKNKHFLQFNSAVFVRNLQETYLYSFYISN